LHPIELYCEKVLEEGGKSCKATIIDLEKAMEQVRKEHYLTFYKHLLDCDIAFGLEFLWEIQTHYDNNPKLEMLTKKLQMFTYFSMSKEQKVIWLRQQNELAC
jgi:hypothetical protein